MGISLLKIGLLFVGYILGSIPSGLLIGKAFMGIDLREHGSKNIGASNAIRVMGLKLGALTLFFDALKSATIVILVKFYF
ncbi:MAG: glycerol-3-phosphate acyltransferase, partial [Acholeplasmataceae bacterium]